MKIVKRASSEELTPDKIQNRIQQYKDLLRNGVSTADIRRDYPSLYEWMRMQRITDPVLDAEIRGILRRFDLTPEEAEQRINKYRELLMSGMTISEISRKYSTLSSWIEMQRRKSREFDEEIRRMSQQFLLTDEEVRRRAERFKELVSSGVTPTEAAAQTNILSIKAKYPEVYQQLRVFVEQIKPKIEEQQKVEKLQEFENLLKSGLSISDINRQNPGLYKWIQRRRNNDPDFDGKVITMLSRLRGTEGNYYIKRLIRKSYILEKVKWNEYKLIVKPKSSFHPRAATQIALATKKFQSKITITDSQFGNVADASSVLSLMKLIRPQEVTINAKGRDAEQAATALADILENKLTPEGELRLDPNLFKDLI